jgi:hypothetical protein
MTKDEALDLALKALRFARDDGYENEVSQQAITAIKQALALDKKAENARELGLDYEPVLKDNSNYRYDPPVESPDDWSDWKVTPPAAQRQWTGLTDDEIDGLYQGAGKNDLKRAREIEAKLKEKNT